MKHRSGSALLIVLGMLSFMVVSAIGFSVFMRQNRLPSSFVRRNTTTHQLLKAALARAMNELDSAIGSDPFPGIDSGKTHDARFLRGVANSYIDDTWKGRVFVGTMRDTRKTNIDTESYNVLIPHERTVSTLTMEGLAYLPPSLVNDARYFSRHTPTAQWHLLDYDAGRYAYTAINVSDYFDINKLPFAEARTYSPANRVSLAYLFRANEKAPPDPKQAKKFYDDVIKNNAPFVSMADFNLVMYNLIGGAKDQEKYGFVSPFGDYATGNTDFSRYFGTTSTNLIANATFVTDSYFPEETVDESLLDLNDEDSQPFAPSFYSKQKDIYDIYEEVKKRDFYDVLKKELKAEFSAPMWANLYDYLDGDSLPVSLALPSVEQVPVVAGFEVKGIDNVSLKIKRELLEGDFDPSTQSNKGAESGETKTIKVKYTASLDNINNLVVDVTTLFPFNKAQCSGFDVEAAAHIFFGIDDNRGDILTHGICESMNMAGGSSQKSEGDLVVYGLFTDKNKEEEGGFDEFNRFTFKPDSKPINGGVVVNEEDALKSTTLSLSSTSKAGEAPLAVVEETWLYQASKDNPQNGTWVHQSSKFIPGHGDIRGLYDEHHNFAPKEGNNYKPYVALRFKVKNKEGVVDLAPACGWDDVHNFNTVNPIVKNYLDMNRSALIIPTSGAKIEYSLNWFQGQTGIAFADTKPVEQQKFSINSLARVCKDPKWNHNVFNWTIVDESIVDDIIKTFNGNGKDGDFFQSVSDSEWLQSVAELAMLPRTTVFNKNANAARGTMNRGSSDESDNFAKSLPLTKKIAQDRGETLYLCASDEYDGNCIESLFGDGSGGFRINPYSDDENIFLAALAYTPYDWNASSPDNDWKFEEAIKKTFSEQSDVPAARLSWTEIREIAAALKEGFTSSDDWVKAYNDLGWNFTGADANDAFENTDLTTADKKFLYGFWKGCFANRQQLFIIFLRAEATISGGGSSLGGRAVAVVWRDPKAPTKDNGDEYDELDREQPPHKMRVLFYKALE